MGWRRILHDFAAGFHEFWMDLSGPRHGTAGSPCPRPAWLSCVSPRLISSWPWLLRLSLSTWQGTYKQIQQWVWSHTWWVPTPEHPRTTVPGRANNPTKITTGFGFFPLMKASTGKWSTNVISLHMGDVQLLQVGLISPISTSQGSSKVPTIDVSSQECTKSQPCTRMNGDTTNQNFDQNVGSQKNLV